MIEDLEIRGLETSVKEKDIEFIKQLVADAEQFQNDPDEYSQLHTEEAIITNIAGHRIIGRDRFYQVMKEAVKTSLIDVPTKTDIENITFVRPDVAVVNCIKHIFDNRDILDGDKFEENSKGNLTFMVVKEQGKWLIAMAQTTLIQNR